MDISKQLLEYSVEYNVLQEELSTPRPETKKLKQMEEKNRLLQEKNTSLMQQLEVNICFTYLGKTVRTKNIPRKIYYKNNSIPPRQNSPAGNIGKIHIFTTRFRSILR